jgi:hypothetical protein
MVALSLVGVVGAGGDLANAPRPRAPAPALRRRRGQRDSGSREQRRGSRSPRHGARAHAAQGDAAADPRRRRPPAGLPGRLEARASSQEHEDAQNYVLPWERRPAWEYLPHLADANPTNVPPLASSSASSTASAVHAGGGGTLQPAATAAIRGQRRMPGQSDARAAIQRSLDDHAERVAAKRARVGDTGDSVTPTAAQRLEAIRSRLRTRLGSASTTSAAGDPSIATATAATAAASHVAWHTAAAARTAPS